MYIKNLSHISLSAKSLDNVKKFYVNLLNLKIIHEFRNKKNNDLYGIFFSSGKGTFLEFFKDKKGWVVRNVIVPTEFQRKGLATKFYINMNKMSLKNTYHLQMI